MPHSSNLSCSSQELNSVDNKLHSHSRKFRFSRACLPACLADYYWKLIFFTCLTLFLYYHPKPFVSLRPFNIDRQQKKLHKQIPRVSPNISRDNIISSIKETSFFAHITPITWQHSTNTQQGSHWKI